MESEQRWFRIYRLWLAAIGVLTILVGILLVFAPEAPWMTAYNRSISEAFWHSDSFAPEAARHNAWLLAVVGAGMVGWGVQWTWVVWVPFARREPWAWWSLAVSAALWVALDVAAAAVAGVAGELWWVAGAGAGAALPIALSWRWFRRGAPTETRVRPQGRITP
jgi:hypothetical protein